MIATLLLLLTTSDATLVAELPESRASGVALDGAGFAYVGAFFGQGVYRVPLRPGSKAQLLYRSPGANIGNVEVRGDRLRWSSNATGRIYEAPLSGRGPIRVLADGMPGIFGFRTDDHFIYWVDSSGSKPGGAWKKPLGGGPSTLLAWNPGHGHAVLLDGLDGDLLLTSGTRRILRIPRRGGAASTWLELDGDHLATGLAQDRDHVYLATYKGKSVVRIDKRTGRREPFAKVDGAPICVAVDDAAVYFTTYMPAALWMRPKTR